MKGEGEAREVVAGPVQQAHEARTLDELLTAVRACRACGNALPLGPRPVLQAGSGARILIVGQAPGARVHASGIPWDDVSGRRLREWLGVDGQTFYDASKFAIVPMGFCYPGRGRSGDLPPRPECSALWFDRLFARLPRIELTLLVGLYAQRHMLGPRCAATLTETVRNWRQFAPDAIPLPHPSGRNGPWFRANLWFEREVLPVVRARVASILRLGSNR